MKKILILLIGLLLQNIIYAQPADVSTGVIDDVSYQQSNGKSLTLPSEFNFEQAIEAMKNARKDGDVQTAGKLSSYIHQWWLKHRTTEFDPLTHGSNPKAYPRKREESGNSQTPPTPSWGTDVRIDSHNIVYDVKVASLSNGHLYTIAIWDSSGNDHILMHRSTDNGASWSIYWNYNFTTAYNIYDPKIQIVNDTIIVSYILQQTSNGYTRTWFRVSLPGSSGSTAIYYGSPTGSFNPVTYSDLDFTTDVPVYPGEQYIYATWVTANQTGTDSTWVMFARSNELDVGTWELGPTIIAYSAGDNIYYAGTKIAYGSNSDRMWLIAWAHPYGYPQIYDEFVRGWYSDNYGSTWSSVVNLTPLDNYRDERECVIAGAHNNTNWVILYTQMDTTTTANMDILNTYSTDDGANWTTSNWVMPATEFLPDIYVDDQSHGFFATLRQNTASSELVKYKFGAIDDPTHWTESITINDNTSNVSDVYGPAITRNMATGDAAIAWTDYASYIYSIWYDAGGTGIAEDRARIINGLSVNLVPNPSNGLAKLSYTLKQQGNVNISIYDASGRLVNSLINETKPAGVHTINLNNQELPNGIYFIRVETPDGITSKPMTVVR